MQSIMPMILHTIILSVWTLVATAYLAPLAMAQAWITEPPCETYLIECLESAQVQERRQYYRLHAQVRPSPEQRLSNGVAWDLAAPVPAVILSEAKDLAERLSTDS